MATAADGRAPSKSGGAEETFRKRLFRPEINEDPQNVSELEQILKRMTFTRSETQHLIELLHSRTIEDSPSPLLRPEASTVVEEEIASPAELANAYKGSSSCIIGQALIQQPMTMENLPDELLSNIFIRLFSKQLAQIRSVSKSWNALLSQPSFIKSHLHHDKNQYLLVFSDEDESEIFTTHLRRSPQLELTNFIKLPLNPGPQDTNGIEVIGAVNGLICSCYSDCVIQIWNPSLSAVSTLPPYSMPFHGYDSLRSYFRFGYDPKTNDYKVVKLTGLIGQPAFIIRWWLQVEIYSMRRGSWELITERIPSHITAISTEDGLCADGRDGYLHWLCCTNGAVIWNSILAFDLGLGTFHDIPFPGLIRDPNRANFLQVLDRKLCVMSWIRDDPCEVWVMEEYGVAESWVKKYIFFQFTKGTYPYGFTSDSELLFHDDGCLVLYDPIANKEKYIENFCHEYYRPQKIVEYVDSLIWIAPV